MQGRERLLTSTTPDQKEWQSDAKNMPLKARIARLEAEIARRREILAKAPVVKKTIKSPQECPWRKNRLRWCEKCKKGKREENRLEPEPLRIIYDVGSCYSEVQYRKLIEKSGLMGIELNHFFENADIDDYNRDLFAYLKQWNPYAGGGIYITSKKDIINPAGNGVGKSYALHALAHRLCRMGIPCLFGRTLDFITRLQSYNEDGYEGESKILKRYTHVPVLLWDDLGKEYFKTEWGCEKFYHVIDYRVKTNKPIVISSNFSLTEIADRLGNRNFGSAIASRLAGFCEIWLLGGPDRRFLSKKEKILINTEGKEKKNGEFENND